MKSESKTKVIDFLMTPPKGVIFILVALFVGIPMFFPLGLPMLVEPQVEEFYDGLMALQPGDTIFVSFSGSPSDMMTGSDQSHWITFAPWAFDRGLNLIIASFGDGKGLFGFDWWMTNFAESQGIAELYGERFVYLGYFAGQEMALAGVLEDVQKSGADYRGVPLDEIPVIEGITTSLDVDAFYHVGAGRSGYAIRQAATHTHWPIFIVSGRGGLTDLLPYYDSGMLTGYVCGQNNVAMWEKLTKRPYQATKFMDSLDMSHVLYVGLIIVSNAAFLVQRSRKEGVET